MKKHVPTKLQNFTDKDGDVWIRYSQPGHVSWPESGWVTFIGPDGALTGYKPRQPEQTFAPLGNNFIATATLAIAALWMTVDVPEVFRTKVGNRSVRFAKAVDPNTVRLLGKWPMSWSLCRVLNGTAQACLLRWHDLNPEWSTAVKAAVEHFWGPEVRQDHTTNILVKNKTPLPNRVFTSTFGNFQWVKGPQPNTVSKKWDNGVLNMTVSWSRREVGPSQPGLEEALDYYWPPSEESTTDNGWAFTCTPEKVDIERCLREAYDAGFREAVIEQPHNTTVYFHREVWELLRKSGQARATWCTFQGTDWAPLPTNYAGMLARARAWEVAQLSKQKPESPKPKASKPTVTVKVSGTK